MSPCLRARLSGVIACVSADMVYEEPARGVALLPGLMAQLAPGYVDAVVLAPGGVGSEELEKVCVRVRERGRRCTGRV